VQLGYFPIVTVVVFLIPFIAFGAFFIAKAIGCLTQYLAVRNVPLISCVDVSSKASTSTTCAVSGTAKSSSRALIAPFSEQPCVWYRIHVEESRRTKGSDDTTNYRHTIKKERTQVPFILEDDTGSVLINAGVASIDGEHNSYRLSVDRNSDLPPSFDLGDWRWGSETNRVIFTEWILPIDEPLLVTGSAVAIGDRNGLDRPRDGQLLVSTRSRNEFLIQKRRHFMVYASLAFACLAIVALVYAFA
jgi:hypothetical protein